MLKENLARRAIDAEVVTVKARDEGLRLLDQRKVEGFASDRMVLIGVVLTSKTKGAFKLLDDDFSVEPYALALPRGDHTYRSAPMARAFTSAIASGFQERSSSSLPPRCSDE